MPPVRAFAVNPRGSSRSVRALLPANMRSCRRARRTRTSNARSNAGTCSRLRRRPAICPKPIALADALALLLLIAVEDPPRYSRAAARWHGRFVVECGLSLEDDALALAALSAVRFSPAALELLEELGTRYRVANVEGALRPFRAVSSHRPHS